MRTLTLGSLFDGIGGFVLAAQRCGIRTLWASEIEPNCIEITKRHFPRVEHLGDIRKIDGGKIPPVDIITFGSPCQDLSTAGKQKGLSGSRSVLFLDAIRIIYEMRRATNGRYPTFVVWENVSGAFNNNKGRDFQTVLAKITNADISIPKSGKWASTGMVRGCRGGANVAWRLLDSQYWGVPQRRKRIFLVGDFRAERGAEILFKPESELGYIDTRRPKKERIAAAVVSDFELAGGLKENSCAVDFGRTADRIYYNADKARTLTATTGGGGSATGNYLDVSEVRPINLQVATRCKALGERTGLGIGDNGAPAYTLQEQHCHAICEVYPIRDPDLNKNANGFIVSADGAPAPTLSATDRHAVAACFAPSGFGGYTEGVGTLRASAGKHGISSANIVAGICENSSGNDIAGTLDASYYKGTGARSGKEREFMGVAMFENNSHGGYKQGCGTLRASGGNCGGGSENLIVIFKGIAFYMRYILRKLTPLECERLQGFPDNWTKYGKSGVKITDTPRYKALGNSLTVPCAERVFRGILAALDSTQEVQ